MHNIETALERKCSPIDSIIYDPDVVCQCQKNGTMPVCLQSSQVKALPGNTMRSTLRRAPSDRARLCCALQHCFLKRTKCSIPPWNQCSPLSAPSFDSEQLVQEPQWHERRPARSKEQSRQDAGFGCSVRLYRSWERLVKSEFIQARAFVGGRQVAWRHAVH